MFVYRPRHFSSTETLRRCGKWQGPLIDILKRDRSNDVPDVSEVKQNATNFRSVSCAAFDIDYAYTLQIDVPIDLPRVLIGVYVILVVNIIWNSAKG